MLLFSPVVKCLRQLWPLRHVTLLKEVSVHEIVIFSIEINNLFNYKPSGIETENLKMAINEFMDKALSLCHWIVCCTII